MKYYLHRILKLLTLLHDENGPLTSREICKQLKIKPRTLRDDIFRYKADLSANGVELQARQGVGYQLNVKDEDKYRALLKSLSGSEQRHHFVAPLRHDERVNYLLRTLLLADDYLKLDKVAEKMFISRSLLNNYMKEVRKALADFNLTLIDKTACGIKLSGSELSIRQAIARFFFYDDSHSDYQLERAGDTRRVIRELLAETLQENEWQLTDTGFQNLVIHLEIALMRINKCGDDIALPPQHQRLKARDEFHIARQLVQRFERVFNLSFPEAECYFISIHLAGKKSPGEEGVFVVPPPIIALFEQITERISAAFAVDLGNDTELYHLLTLHLTPMIDRLQWDLKIHNLLLEQIKEENVTAFEMAVLAAKTVCLETGLVMNEAETGYLAVHFALALERRKVSQKKVNLILVCASGMGSSQLLLYKLKQHFSGQINLISVVQLYQLNHFDSEGYDLILSTVDIPFPVSLPLLRINYFLDPAGLTQMEKWLNGARQDVHLISQYFHPDLFFTDLHSNERYALINELCQRVSSHIATGKDFARLVIEREQLSATEFGHAIAFPHPLYPVGRRTFVTVAVLNKPLRWDKQNVRYVFMLNIREGETASLQRLYETLMAFMCDGKKLKELGDNTTFTTFVRLLEETILQAEQQSDRSPFR
ncbi:BglG family transcription antiterminator [Erwinia mallotivora]|uniref:Uncharacterized protein n=1 Tax=Erwinia mallotivora TaxID=69222 RepID=A0A014Q241_9GAMM|nr:PRD domain-containing protein [Erwinia mallotivora]EXU77197.1 hypothetical protein BG55_02220 [Erwinia mallotivora]